MCHRAKSISLLLGAGFSVSAGFPTVDIVNEKVLNLRKQGLHFMPNGILAKDHDPGFTTQLEVYYPIFLDIIDYYNTQNSSNFNYEVFYDYILHELTNDNHFIKKAVVQYPHIDVSQSIYHFKNIYNQIIHHCIQPSKFDYDNINDYNIFKEWVTNIIHSTIINIHTLNHDIFLETRLFPDNVSDGYEHNGLYFCKNVQTHLDEQIPMFTNNYHNNLRLFKLHGSFDHYICDFEGEKDYVKISGVHDYTMIKNTKNQYDIHNYHPDFLSGTTAKLLRYDETHYQCLFNHFRTNIQNAEMIIIIGYGGNDSGINNILKQGASNKQMIVISKKINENFIEEMKKAGWLVTAISKPVGEISMTDLTNYNPIS